ncbi:SapC family protein [Stakelama sp. CBK3Z-3]|uniref:SapC family protein n=1 Tax=Stakelama flava TaxID=2860338 RepID=A0ABS6XJL1_9SPHN|nr:SapC family protein [Stakelama flava]MBW4330398.1 SapC family protein [Stakelama flava]
MSDHQPLTAQSHRALTLHHARGAEYGDAVMCCVTVPDEFRRVQNEYPILFRLNTQRDSFAAMALFGFEDGENLFLDGDRWNARYRPLAMDIQPFLIGRPAPDSDERQVHIDMTSPRISPDADGIAVFDDAGQPTPYLERAIEQLGQLDTGYARVGDFIAALRRYDLLEPLAVEIPLADGSVNRLVGFHTINEDRVRALDAAALGDLHAAGHLMPIFMAIASMSNFDDLIRRKNHRLGYG